MKIQLPVLTIQVRNDLPQMFLTALSRQIHIGGFDLKQLRKPVNRFSPYRKKLEDLIGLRLDLGFQLGLCLLQQKIAPFLQQQTIQQFIR